jgi:hypothetical protein
MSTLRFLAAWIICLMKKSSLLLRLCFYNFQQLNSYKIIKFKHSKNLLCAGFFMPLLSQSSKFGFQNP